jgi:very-short-patch-repair endonuclease
VTGTPTQRQSEIAALRRAGPASTLTGITALQHHGVRAPASTFVTVLVPAAQRRRSEGFVRIWATTRMPEFVFTDGAVRFAEAARAVADAARELGSFREVRAVAAAAVQQRRCRLDQLLEELAHAPVRQSAWLRRALAEVADGVRSAAEGDLRSLIRAAGLPAPIFNARLYIGSELLAVADAWWPDAGVAVEVDSRAWHLSPADWERTLRRSARMTIHGILVVHVTPHQLKAEPGRIVADIRSALATGRERPPLAVRTLPATG